MTVSQNSSSTDLLTLTETILSQEALLREGGGKAGKERQTRLGRLTARERLAILLDNPSDFFELGLWAGYGMYSEWGELPAAGVITGIGKVCNRSVMVIANDATVKAGAMFPQSVKKVLRAQRIAFESSLPVIYLVDSSGVFLPLQDEIFPDEDDFGRIFRNNAIFSATGIPQFAAIMGNCIAGGGYLPVLCDQLLMTDGSGLYLAGPALVKAAIGQEVDPESLGGAKMHASISGTVDFREHDDPSCLKRLRSLIDMLPSEHVPTTISTFLPSRDPRELYQLVGSDSKKEYDVHHVIECIVDAGTFQENKAEYGKTVVTGYAKIQGIPIGIVANQRISSQNAKGEIEIGGVLYSESADKAARFVMDCNQMRCPILFLQDVMGFMVGREAEESGIIRSGTKLVNAISNSIVPKITIIIGNSFGAGHYAMCGKAYDPRFILAWPNAKYSVMGAEQASDTLLHIQKKAAEREGKPLDEKWTEEMSLNIQNSYQKSIDIRYGAARGWVDGIIAPHSTRDLLTTLLGIVNRPSPATNSQKSRFHTGVIQV